MINLKVLSTAAAIALAVADGRAVQAPGPRRRAAWQAAAVPGRRRWRRSYRRRRWRLEAAAVEAVASGRCRRRPSMGGGMAGCARARRWDRDAQAAADAPGGERLQAARPAMRFAGRGGGPRGGGYHGGGYRHHHRGGGGFWPGVAVGVGIGSTYGYYGSPSYYDDSYGYYDDSAVAAAPPSDDDAVAYCTQRYRSYDPASGTYLGNDGLRHPCPAQ